ncbi:MAG: helix-turn-helix domain-containing protein [Clostridia bacterium]|nr:helix-turn-helix domain-containing protein [Clostridia bacterium]
MFISSTIYTKTLCMSELRVGRLRMAQTHYFDTSRGSDYTSFVFARRGAVSIHTLDRTLDFAEGSLIYIPEGQRFTAVWRGSPEIEFLHFHIINRKLDLANTDRYVIQRIDALSTPETEAIFQRVFALFATGERVDRVRAIGLYYSFYADVLPHLRAEPPVEHNPILRDAIAYIERHCTEDFAIRTLAARVCVSESRLHHLFKRDLNTTPIKLRNEFRVERAAHILRSTERSIEDIAAACGFHSPTYFRETFKAFTGLTPLRIPHAGQKRRTGKRSMILPLSELLPRCTHRGFFCVNEKFDEKYSIKFQKRA